MSNKLVKVAPILTALLLLTMLAVPVYATGAHLWFYSVEPPIPLPNPDGWDPNYVDVTSDPWTTESVAVPQGDWEDSFYIWIGNADPQDDCYDTTLVISINDAAAPAIDAITVNPGDAVISWNTDEADFPLPPHGISNSAEWYGFAEVVVGDIPSGGKLQIQIDIDLLGAVPSEAKIHFDAYGWSDEEHTEGYDIFSPFSHDYTFIIPEPATIFLMAASLTALGIYTYKRKKY